MSPIKKDNNDERLEILLALALDDTLKDHDDVEGCSGSPCPGEEELVAWHEGRLSESRRQELVNHLGECQKCYELWVGLGALPSDL